MANINITAGARSYHGTTTVGSVDVVLLDKPYREIEFICHDASTPMYVTVDRGVNDEQTSTPSVAGAGSLYVGPNDSVRIALDDSYAINQKNSKVRITSAAAVAYSVTGHGA